ncbi:MULTISPECIES: hypothetical protein [Bacillus]|uniref:hypothetical protein n=1 Tax=Bacillus TaxID=1386 RepID=UPI0035A01A8C
MLDYLFSKTKNFKNKNHNYRFKLWNLYFFWGSFVILNSFILLLTHALDLTHILLYSTKIALEVVTIPRKLFLPSVTEAASFC